MIEIIGGILVVLFIIALCVSCDIVLFNVLSTIGSTYLIFAPLVVSAVAIVVLFIVCSVKSKLSKAEKAAISEAHSLDIAEEKNYESQLKMAKSKVRSRIERERAEANTKISNMKSEINGLLKEILAIDCLSEQDLYLDCVDRLIELISSRRADSIKEALQMYDTEREKKMNAEMKLAMERMDSYWQEMKDEEDRRRRIDDAFSRLEETERQKRIDKNLEDIKKRLSED